MSPNYRLLPFTSFLMLFHGSVSLVASGGRRSSAAASFAVRPYSQRQHPTQLAAFSNPALNLSSGLFNSSGNTKSKDRFNHRHSASDWLHNVNSLPQSTVLQEIRNPVITVALWGTVVAIVHKHMARCSNQIIQKLARDMCIGSTPHSFLVSSLGLLLVFRTNSAYQRFAEGRKIWENILSVSRNTSRLVNLYSKEVGSERKSRILNLTAAFPYLLRHHIREGCLCEDPDTPIPNNHRLMLNPPPVDQVDTRHEGDKTHSGQLRSTSLRKPCWVDTRKLPWSLFPRKSLQYCASAQNRPLWVCDRVGREMMSIPYGPNFTSRERLTLLGQVEKLTKAIGECERIHQTAVPLNYARHSLRSLSLWLLTLPFALIKDMGMLTGPVMGVIAWLLFGVYQIGYSIEDPFQGSLRLSILCDAIRRDVVGETDYRDTAFSLEDTPWAEDEELDEEVPEFNDLTPILQKGSVDQVVLSQPRLVKKKNGSWDVVKATRIPKM